MISWVCSIDWLNGWIRSFGGSLLLIFWLIIIIIILSALKSYTKSNHGIYHEKTLLELLNQRLAAGEITEEEYEQIRVKLRI